METKPNLASLKELLKRGDVAKAAERADVTTMSIYNVLNGKYKNERVLTILIEVIKEREEKRKEAIDSLLKILK